MPLREHKVFLDYQEIDNRKTRRIVELEKENKKLREKCDSLESKLDRL